MRKGVAKVQIKRIWFATKAKCSECDKRDTCTMTGAYDDIRTCSGYEGQNLGREILGVQERVWDREKKRYVWEWQQCAE